MLRQRFTLSWKYEVTYYYESPGKVIVNYYDKDTNKKLTEEVIIDGYTGEKYKTEEKNFEYYKLVETKGEKEGQIEGEKHVDYVYQKMKFNFKVDKTIDRIETGGTSQTVSGKLGKTEIYRKELNSTNVRVTYKIKVTNDGEVAGSAELQENIPQEMTWHVNNDKTWKVSNTVASIETGELKPGESREYTVVLDCPKGDVIGTKVNTVEISKTKNKAGFEETTKNDNTSSATVIIAIGTGDMSYVIIAIISAMVLIGAGYVVYKNKKDK